MIRTQRLTELDLLRFVAALAVLLFHFTGFGGAGPWPGPSRELFQGVGHVTRYGYLGVDLFFVISGFVILMSAWGRSLGDFAVSRVVRLMPAYWAAVLIGAVIFMVFRLGQGSPARALSNLTMLQAPLGTGNVDPVFWTLWVELHFYVLMAVLVGVGLTYRRCVLFMTAWLFLGLYADEGHNKLLQILVLPTWNSYFIAGMALYLIYRFGPNLLLWGFVAVSWLLAMHWSAWRAGPVFSGVDDTVVRIGVTCVILVMILVATGRLRWLRWRGFTLLGTLTYPLYLTHSQIALPLLRAIYPRMDKWGALAVAMACSLAVAYVLQRWVERPVATWLKPRLRAALARVRAVDAPAPTRIAAPQPTEELAGTAQHR